MNMIDYVVHSTNHYIEEMPKEQRKKYGQFFTSKETALFMASLFDLESSSGTVSILDPGAGSGILSTALIARMLSIPTITKIKLVCYEKDTHILKLLRSNMEWVSKHASKPIDYEILEENYILSQEEDYNHPLGESYHPVKYDFVISNPPYMKISKDALEAKAMKDVCYGAPNLYFLFASMSLFNLKANGEMVYIIPRSWTSGAYFKQFREKFLEEGALEHIHLFVRRDKVFEKESVLQETIIIKVRKTKEKPENILITTTQSNADFSKKTIFNAPYDIVVRGEDHYVYLVTNPEEVKTLKKLNCLPNTLPSLGLKMKTGLTVDFRNREALRDQDEERAVPLFYCQHIKNGKVEFPIGKEHEYLVTEQNGLRQKNSNYLFVKRFTAKEEHRRLQCGIYLASMYPQYDEISTQNKINFICGHQELSESTVSGLYVLFNSTLYDSYYRILNGSTQVNSTEINTMPIPAMNTIEAMGNALIRSKDFSESSCDNILRSYL